MFHLHYCVRMSKINWICRGCEKGMSMCYGSCDSDVLTGYEIANDYDGFYWTPAPEGSMSALEEKYTYIRRAQCGQNECSSFCTAGICLACNKSHCKLHLKWFGRKRTRLCNNCSVDRTQVERILLDIKDPSVTELKSSGSDNAMDEKVPLQTITIHVPKPFIGQMVIMIEDGMGKTFTRQTDTYVAEIKTNTSGIVECIRLDEFPDASGEDKIYLPKKQLLLFLIDGKWSCQNAKSNYSWHFSSKTHPLHK